MQGLSSRSVSRGRPSRIFTTRRQASTTSAARARRYSFSMLRMRPAYTSAAFSTAAGADAPPETIAAVVKTLADCAGPLGMVGGQVLDMEGEQKQLDAQGLLDIHSRKTGALIVAACTLGVLAARGTQAQLDAARQYAEALGLAFQIKDDMLDETGDAAKLGKAVHMDGNKTTFVTLYGLEACETYLQQENAKALAALEPFEDRAFLTELTKRLASRDH